MIQLVSQEKSGEIIELCNTLTDNCAFTHGMSVVQTANKIAYLRTSLYGHPQDYVKKTTLIFYVYQYTEGTKLEINRFSVNRNQERKKKLLVLFQKPVSEKKNWVYKIYIFGLKFKKKVQKINIFLYLKFKQK